MEIRILSDDELKTITGGEAISEAVGLLQTLARVTAGAINSELHYLSNVQGINSWYGTYQLFQSVVGKK